MKLEAAFGVEEILYIKGICKLFTYKYEDSCNFGD
jgi:hypothetical protein